MCGESSTKIKLIETLKGDDIMMRSEQGTLLSEEVVSSDSFSVQSFQRGMSGIPGPVAFDAS